VVGALAVLVASIAGCGLPKTDDGGFDDISMADLGAVEAQINRMLHALFPDLSEDELAEIRVSLDLEDVLALRDELDAIRESVEEFSAALFVSAEERVAEREMDLADHNDGFPEGLAAIGHVCRYDQAAEHAEIDLSGVLNGQEGVLLTEDMISVTIDGEPHDFTLSCLSNGPTVDIVFLIDITGSMSNVIDSVRDSVVDFVDVIASSGLEGTLSIVTFQDTVGVNRTFQQTAPANDYERSPFFAPVDIASASAIAELRSFVNRLEANRGADAPENLAGAIDFARNSVIGYEAGSTDPRAPNVIGDGRQDPAGTAPFPPLRSEHQVFVVLTDVTFHGDDRTDRNSSLEAAFVPRDAADILGSLHETRTVVHVSDPSWSDASLDTTDSSVDADYWAVHTGGVGEDTVLGYSLVDLELVVVAEETGLFDITLDTILSSSCNLDLDVQLDASAEVSLELNVEDLSFTTDLTVVRF